jgi:hypothetical protein
VPCGFILKTDPTPVLYLLKYGIISKEFFGKVLPVAGCKLPNMSTTCNAIY